MDTFFKKLLDLIPEATYDLISRMVPGGLVVAILASSYYPQTFGFSLNTNSETLAVTIFLVLSYATGMAVSTLAHPLYWGTWPFVYAFLATSTDANERLMTILKSTLKVDSLKLDWKCPLNASFVLDRAHDLIKTKDPTQGMVVTKLSAEVSLVYGLAIASGLYTVLNCYKFWPLPLVLLFAGFLRSIRLWQRHASILQAVSSMTG
ncbi:MAG TPA: hypothetical protein VKS43_05885 [Burkholderiales bacterium]|nr:hypothetical protein [Burkholderiales bacterium]